MSCQMNQKEIQYFSTTLSPYSEDLEIIPSAIPKAIWQAETYAKLETGLDDFQIYTGIGKQGNQQGYWMQIKSSFTTSTFTTISLKKDDLLKICKDTIRHKLSGDSTMVAFEIIHHLSTGEIQYVWLNEYNNRSEKAIIIQLDLPLKEGKKFPDLTVEQINSEKLSFNDLIGKTVVVNWWHIACAPCIEEMPGLNKLVERFKQNPNVVFVAIANNKKEHVTRFLEEREFNYIQTLANEEDIKLFGNAFPVHLIINSEGKICYFSKGGSAEIYIKIESILNGMLGK